MWRKVLVLAMFAVLSPNLVSAAEEAAPAVPAIPPFKFETSLNRVDQKVIKLLGPDQQKALRRLAEAAVLSDFCAAINLNQNKFKQEFDALAVQGAPRKPAEQRDMEHQLSMYFGVYVGLFVAEGADRKAEFCAVAEGAMKDQKPISQFWTAASVAPETPKQ